MDTVHFGRALYYPHIFPRSRQWLRTSALYHDRIGRIVPHGFLPSDHNRHKDPALRQDFEALQEGGFIENAYPKGVLNQVGEQFIEFIAPFLDGDDRRERLRRELGSEEWKPYNMYRGKIDQGLVELLEPEGLIRRVNDHEVEFDASIGGLYMLFLARELAKHQPIVSDEPMYEALALTGVQKQKKASSNDAGLLLANAIFTSIVPIDIESIDIHDLLKFREDSSEERIAFYDGLASIRADLSKLTEQKQLHEAVEHHAAAIKTKMSSLEMRLGALKLKCGNGVFSFSLPGALVGSWGLKTDNPAVLIGGGTLVIAGIIVNSVLDHWIARSDSPLRYVHSMRNNLQPKEYARKMADLTFACV